MSTHPAQASPARPAMSGLEVRASDADRDAAAGLLNTAFAEGRLTADEHGQRLEAAYAARTWQQLHQLTADLPAPSGAVEPVAPAGFTAPGLCLLCVLLCVCPPAAIAWWLLSRRRPRHRAGCPAHPRGRARRGGRPAPRPAGRVLLTAALVPAGARSQLGVRMT